MKSTNKNNKLGNIKKNNPIFAHTNKGNAGKFSGATGVRKLTGRRNTK